MGEAGDRRGHRPAVLGDQPGGDRAGAGHADLLADHGADRGLVAVDLAGHPEPGRAADQRPDHRVLGEVVVHRQRVAVGVERGGGPARPRRGVAQVGELERRGDERGLTRAGRVRQVESDGAGAVRQVEGAGVPAVAGGLDARDQVVGQEVEERPAGERGPDRQPHRHRAGRRAAARRGARAGRSATTRRPRGWCR